MKINHLTVAVSGKTVVKDFSLELETGQLHVLLGPNGSGKTSLGLALAGHPDYGIISGELMIDGENWLQFSPEVRAQRGLFLAFQNPVAVPGVKVNQFLRQAYLSRFAESKRKFKTALEFFGHLEKVAKKLQVDPTLLSRGLNENFSGGERKRLEMLQLIVLAPRFAILDELDSGLDIDALKIIKKTVDWLQAEFQTRILLITHYSRILKYVTPDRVHVMTEGCLRESGGVELLESIDQKGFLLSKKKEQSYEPSID